MGSPSGASANATTPVDGSDRKFFIKAAEKSGDDKVLRDFDAALDAQRNQPPPTSPQTSPRPDTASSDRVQPMIADDPSDQKLYNMAADRQNKVIDLERRAASLQQDIDALGTSGGYVTDALRADLRDVQNQLDGLQVGGEEPPVDPSISAGERLARQYAPVLVLPGGEYDLPADPQDFIDNSRYREDRSFWGDKEHGNNINGDGSDDFTAADVGQSKGGGEFLDLADNRWNLGSEDAPFFYQVDDPDNPTKITYWFFYSYNDGPGPQNHEGDFERITLEIDPETGRPTDAIYSAHGNKHTKPVPFDQLQFYVDPVTGEPTDKPLVYVASGSHASYPTPGVHTSDAPGVLRDVAGDSVDDHTVASVDDAAHVIDTGANLADVQQQDWYPESGEGIHWGEPGDADDLPGFLGGGSTSGPRGPSDEKDHVELD